MKYETRIGIAYAMMAFASELSKQSHCERGQHACVLADADMQVLAYGYNGVASGLPNRCLHPDQPGACGCVHAETNALAKRRHGDPYYAFITGSPCALCAQLLITSGVRGILYLQETSSFHDHLVGGDQVLQADTLGVKWGRWPEAYWRVLISS